MDERVNYYSIFQISCLNNLYSSISSLSRTFPVFIYIKNLFTSIITCILSFS